MWMHPHPENFMETNTNTPEAKQPASAGCHPTPCSPLEILEPPAERTSSADPTHVGGCALILIAMAGYMKDRHLLCDKLSDISSLYDRDIMLRKSIIDEIERIDAIAAKILQENK